MKLHLLQIPLVFVLSSIIALSAFAQEPQNKGVRTLQYLQKEPATLFDIGMKRLRSSVLDTVGKMISRPGMQPTASITYNQTAGIIEILFNLKTEATENTEILRQQCLTKRKTTILKMFQIGKTNYASQLSVTERIQRRIGRQFVHEAIDSAKNTLIIGDQLGQITYVAVTLTTTDAAAVSITCRALVTDLLIE